MITVMTSVFHISALMHDAADIYYAQRRIMCTYFSM